MQTPTTKTCLGCRRNRAIDRFAKHAAEPDGHQKVCRSCQRLRRLVYSRTPRGIDARRTYDSSKYGQQRRNRWRARRLNGAQ